MALIMAVEGTLGSPNTHLMGYALSEIDNRYCAALIEPR